MSKLVISSKEDISSTIETTLKKANDPIERMVTRQVGIIYGYYKNVNNQAEESLRVSHRVTYVALACLVIAIMGVFAAITLQKTEIAILNGIPALISGIAVVAGKLNRTYDKAAVQRSYFFECIKRFHELLLAYEISRKVEDETQKQQKIGAIIDGLIKTEDASQQFNNIPSRKW